MDCALLTTYSMRLSPSSIAIAVITAYQKTLSPDHGPLRHLHAYGYCRHSPTCSQYGKQVIAQRGLLLGGWLLLKRILSCHPWAKISDEKYRTLAADSLHR